MSDETKSCSSPASAEPTAARSHLPMWILVLTLLLLYVGGIYFDRHSGWFDKQVYSPFANAAMLDAYQPKSGAAAAMAQGKKVYEQICAACHGADGMGKPGQAPPLTGSEIVTAKGYSRLAHIPLLGLNGPIEIKGQQMSFPSGMAAMGAALSDADLAAVLSYIRTSWGNKADVVMPEDIKGVRAGMKQSQPLTHETMMAMPE
jgi:mono/diheme cytochrome c family protein